MAKLTHEEILAYLEEATILELNELVKAIEEKFDVTAAAPVAVVAGGDAAGADAAPANVTVTLTDVGATKVAVIKAVRETPAEIKKDVPAEEGAKIKEQLEAAGATVEVK